MVLAPLSSGFQSLPPLPTMKLGPFGADSQVGGLVQAVGPWGSLQGTLLWGRAFLLLLPQPPTGVFNQRFEALFPQRWSPGLCGLFHSPAITPSLSMCECGAAGAASHHLVWSVSCSQACPIPQSATLLGLPAPALPRVLSAPAARLLPPLLPVWLDVSSLSPWLWVFHTVWFSVSSGCFLFLNCCCPPFGCARRHSVSTYSSYLAGVVLICISLNTYEVN